jgi:putative transposase
MALPSGLPNPEGEPVVGAAFDTIEALRQDLLLFRQTYNATWLIERHGFITPTAFRRNQLQPAALAA